MRSTSERQLAVSSLHPMYGCLRAMLDRGGPTGSATALDISVTVSEELGVPQCGSDIVKEPTVLSLLGSLELIS
jgi:hypothetical protein